MVWVTVKQRDNFTFTITFTFTFTFTFTSRPISINFITRDHAYLKYHHTNINSLAQFKIFWDVRPCSVVV